MTLAVAPPTIRHRPPVARWRGPRYPGEVPTLGHGVINWIESNLPSPDDATAPFRVTDEQADIILHWYALDPETGSRLHHRGRVEMPKGWGKSPIFAAIALCEFVGPVCFDGWDVRGEPIAVPWGTGGRGRPVIEIAAVSEDQTDNTYAVLYEMVTANEQRVAKRLGIDPGRTRLYLLNRPGELRPVTASSASREGARLTFAVLDETHLWFRANGGLKLAGVLRRNAAKMGGTTFETTNAPLLGEKSVAEASGTKPEPGVYHYVRRPTIEPSPELTDAELRRELVYLYGDARWIDPDRLLKDIRDPATAWDDALRYFFNVRTSGEMRAVDSRLWDSLRRTVEVPAGTLIGVGFDGSEFHDATVLRGCTADGHSFILGRWSRPPGAMVWQVPRLEVEQAVAEAFSRYTVGLMLCDPPRWWTEIAVWQERWTEDRVKVLDTYSPRQMAPAVDRWRTAIRAGTHTHDGDPFTSDQVKATRLKKVRINDVEDDRTMYLLDKDGRIGNDAAIADCLAYEAAFTMVAPPPKAKPFVVFGKAR